MRISDPFCAEHLDAEYGALVRKLVAKLARKRPSPIHRGDPRIWAGAALYTVGGVNFLFDKTQRPHLSGDDLCARLGVTKSTVANKAKVIRDMLGIGQMEPEFCRREVLEAHPLAWMVSIDGFLVDARTLPLTLQREAVRRGLIPELPPARGGGAHGAGDGGEAR